MHFVYKTDNLFRSIRVRTKTHLLQRDFIILNLFELQILCVFKMHHSKPQKQFSTLSDFIWSFSGIHSYFWAKWPWKLTSTTNDLWKGWNLAWCHHFTHIACAKKLRGLRQKLDALRVQNGQSLSKYQGSDENSSVTKGFHYFRLIWSRDSLCVQNAPFKATSAIFNPFRHSLIFLS